MRFAIKHGSLSINPHEKLNKSHGFPASPSNPQIFPKERGFAHQHGPIFLKGDLRGQQPLPRRTRDDLHQAVRSHDAHASWLGRAGPIGKHKKWEGPWSRHGELELGESYSGFSMFYGKIICKWRVIAGKIIELNII